MSQKLLIGLDFGSDSVRALLITSDGMEIASEVAYYPRWAEGKYSDAAAAQFRQHPADYLECMTKVIREVVSHCDPADIKAIGIDTTGTTVCAVDEKGTPLSLTPEFAEDPDAMFLLWKDHTSIAESDRINEVSRNWDGGNYTKYEGGIYSCEWFWSKVLHVLKNNDRVRAKAAGFAEHCDWMAAELSGSGIKLNRCTAGHKMLWHESWNGLPPVEFFEAVDPLLVPFRRTMSNKTFTAGTPAGILTPEWAEKLGLSSDVVISIGALDAHVGAVGAGITPGDMVKVLGTSTCDMLVVREIDKCIPGICGQVNGSILPGYVGLEAGQSAFGDIYAWFRRFLSRNGITVELPELEKEAAALPDTPVMALDWMNGRRNPDADPMLNGAIFGLTLGTTPAMVYRALVESTVFGSRAIFERLKQYGVEIKNVKAIGGIAKKSPFVMQFCADALNIPISIVKSEQTCALGAAMFAAVAAGIFRTVEDAQQSMQSGYDKVYTPQRSCDERFAKYMRYAAAVEALKD